MSRELLADARRTTTSPAMNTDPGPPAPAGGPVDLAAYGWDPPFAEQFEPHRALGLEPGRVALARGISYRIWTAQGEREARLAGRLRHRAAGQGAFPAVGDWVALRRREPGSDLTIQAVLPRRTRFSRKAAGEASQEQVIAANVDTVLLVNGLDDDFNLRRLERYLVLAWESGAQPAVVLSKADLCADPAAVVRQVEAIAPGVPVHPISARRRSGLEALAAYLRPGRTVALLGSSGTGKSTLINGLLGRARQRTGAVRSGDGRGRHTTTHRELIVLPGGALVIDTPGLRELQLWSAEAGHEQVFEDLEALAATCRFADCGHESEPGCAVRRAVAEGTLAAERFEHYRQLDRELRHLATRLDERTQREQRRQARVVERALRRQPPKG